MNDYSLYSTAEAKKRGLNRRFVIAGLLGIFLIVTALTAGGYYRLQKNTLAEMASRVAGEMQQLVIRKSGRDSGASTELDSEPQTLNPNEEPQAVLGVGKAMQRITGVTSVRLFDASFNPVWSSSEARTLPSEQRAMMQTLLREAGRPYRIVSHDLLTGAAWWQAITRAYPLTEMLVIVRQVDGTPLFAHVKVDHRAELGIAQTMAVRLLLFLAVSTLVLFYLLYYIFQRGIQTINEQENRLNDQIARLSNLLSANKELQKSMKTASARAVELNEQFLRRVGADLHDGPAQMIGFAVLRLAQISKHEAAQNLGHEFHAVKDALNESLEEIRGISSGLVLPQLEQMSLEQCLRKVVLLHSAKSDTEVTQYYQDLPDDIPLPIKITAYRFIQEALNNSHRHGQAKKCRLNAFVKDDVLHLSLKDNGVGFRLSSLSTGGGHLGLMGLKDRIESLGGKFNINSELGVGTSLRLSISLDDDA
ncbi:two-component sensor histidine kinase [Arenicella chitinivorans]|uniref:Two-component sensor histidine kinase n=1 Tax=Arenicella chitinivorans TaxID=1329800 RepID=A0A918RX58_9GAMM|nr:ATP-binding protein [Arenicella chitinivorans]GHA15941.1 two-component sensor histidine kinase [Arenicella chitinivorans]